jgi:hypothetical protein
VCNSLDDDCDGAVDLPGCDPTLVVWYRFEESVGAVWDSSGNALHATAQPTVLRGQPGRVGSAIRVNGTAGSRVELPDSPALAFGSGLTVEAWVRAEDCSHALSDHNTLVAKEGEILLAFTPTCEISNYVNDGMWRRDTTMTTLPTASWHHMALTFDGATIRSYLDGQPAGAGIALAGAIADTGSRLVLGARPDCCVQTLNGLLDEVRLYRAARTQAQICGDLGGTWDGASCTVPP